jgi:hypothetical protein
MSEPNEAQRLVELYASCLRGKYPQISDEALAQWRARFFSMPQSRIDLATTEQVEKLRAFLRFYGGLD